MLVFKNKEKGTHFCVNNPTGEVLFLFNKEFSVLRKFSKMFGDLDYLELPNYKIVQQFRKLVKTGILKDVDYKDTKTFFKNNYPELFI